MHTHIPWGPSQLRQVAEVEVLADGSLTTDYADSTSDVVDSIGAASIDFFARFTADFGATLAEVTYRPEWSIADTPSADTDWSPYLGEEFEIGATPTGNGSGVSSPYETVISVPDTDLPVSYGITVSAPRGRWQRLRLKGDGSVTGVLRRVTSMVR